jgi:hypothetical protein
MPCNHKFQQHLNLERIDFKPNTLIVGTFNPAWPAWNEAQWFYGRTNNNNFWDVLPRLYDEESLINAQPEDWRSFCHEKKIAITDLISCITDAQENDQDHAEMLGSYSDMAIANNFLEFDFTNIVSILENHPTIRNVYLTRGVGPTFWKRQWRPIKNYCEHNDLRATALLTPSGYAYYQQGRYNNQNPNTQLNLQDFILMKWSANWHEI